MSKPIDRKGMIKRLNGLQKMGRDELERRKKKSNVIPFKRKSTK